MKLNLNELGYGSLAAFGAGLLFGFLNMKRAWSILALCLLFVISFVIVYSATTAVLGEEQQQQEKQWTMISFIALLTLILTRGLFCIYDRQTTATAAKCTAAATKSQVAARGRRGRRRSTRLTGA